MVLSRIVTSSMKSARSVHGVAETVAEDPIDGDGEVGGEAIRLGVAVRLTVRGVDVVPRLIAEEMTSASLVEVPPPAGLAEGWKLQLMASHATAAASAVTLSDRPAGVICPPTGHA